MKTDFYKMECDILVALSDFKPHNQNQMADLIGNHEKSTDRVHVSRCLKTIKSYLKRVPNDFGESGNRWVLRQDIQALRLIAEKYPSIIPDLQKNNKIVSMVAEKQNLFIKHPLASSELKMVKKMLKLSRSFFHNYVVNPNFLDVFEEAWLEDNREEMEEDGITLDYKAGTQYERITSDGVKWKFQRETSPIDDILINSFTHSILNDKIINDYNPKSLDFLKTTFRNGFISCVPEKEPLLSRRELLKVFRKKNPRYVLRYTLIKV